MQKAEYRYYEISQDLPVMALSGKKWEIIYGTDNMHFHNCLEIGYCHYGNGTICVAEKELPYHAGTITFIPKNTPHRTCPTPEERGKKQKWEYLFVDVEEILKRGFVNVPEKYIYVEQNLSKKISVLENAGSTKAAALMQMIIEEIQLRQANYRYTVSTLAFNLVLFFDRLDNENIKFQNNSRETSDYTRKIISYIELHYMEDIGGKDFARACNLSETHMRRIFIESANITPSEYLNLVRIKKACEMLAKEKCSIEKVSNSVGYPVISTFMRNCKKITGISPNAWRRKALENPENVAAYQVSVFKGW